MSDELDAKSDAELNEIFAVEVAGMVKRTEGLVWDNGAERAYILAGSALHDVRRKMELPCDNGVLLAFSTDANAVLPWLERTGLPSPEHWIPAARIEWHGTARYPENLGWNIDLGEHNKRNHAPTFARAACIALIRAKRAQSK